VHADPDAEPQAIQAVLKTLNAQHGLRARGIGWAASYDAPPWELVDEPNPSRLTGGLYRNDLAAWLPAPRADT
jgi:hypothetical protein